MPENGYTIRSLHKYYGKFQALNDVNLSLKRGKIIGLLGKNGAGKSTLMRCMLGFISHQGDVFYDDIPILRRKARIFEHVAFIPDVSGLDDRLTVAQTVDYISNINPRWNQEKASRLVKISDLPFTKKVSKLSKGMKTKLYLLITLALDVDYLLLDEPTLGLDIVYRKEFFNSIMTEFYAQDKGILISTHQVEEIEEYLDEVIFIDEGKILLHEEVKTLKERYRVLSINVKDEAKLQAHQPKYISHSLGFASAVLDSSVEIEGAIQSEAGLADIFLMILGAKNETV